jgi:hypothetical protein
MRAALRASSVLLALSCAARAQGIIVKGMVAHPGAMDSAALSTLPQSSVTGSFDSMSGKQTHSWTGPLLLDVLNQASVTDEPGKRTHMRHVILAEGSDGYAAAIAIGEIDAKGEGKHVIVALTQDGKPMKTPRIVVPGDVSLTRCVHDLAVVEVR